MTYDYLIVGAGFAGSVMARQLADAGKRVLIIDKRDHIGGNAYDYVNEHGVRIHKYGPHIFHTNSDRVFAYLSNFTQWRAYEHRVLASVDGKLVPFPINIDTINQLYGTNLDDADGMRAFLAERVARDWPEGKEVRTAEDQIVSQAGRELFETFFAGYTLKMWGVPASQLDKSVTARIPVRFNHDDRYFTDKHQAMPRDGYTALFERMLDHPGIEVRLSTPYWHDRLAVQGRFEWPDGGHVWTAPIDEYFGHCFGPLPYRSLRFEQTNVEIPPPGKYIHVEGGREWVTTNWPENDVFSFSTKMNAHFTRATWMGALTDTNESADVLVSEFPCTDGEPYYPIPSPESAALYAKYEALARAQSNVIFIGRLGRYQYMNMDQVVGQALATFDRLKLGQAA